MRRLRNGERVMAMRSLRHQGVNVGEGDRGIVGSVVGARLRVLWNNGQAGWTNRDDVASVDPMTGRARGLLG